jgi:negative regulator of replication initiation
VLSAINKYLTVLGWVNKNRPTEFLKILDFRRGDRLYFGKSQRQVEDSGEGIDAKQIPGSDIWAMSTLDNRTKRNLLADLLSLFGFHAGEINVVVDSIPDSGRHRGQGRLSSYLDAKP